MPVQTSEPSGVSSPGNETAFLNVLSCRFTAGFRAWIFMVNQIEFRFTESQVIRRLRALSRLKSDSSSPPRDGKRRPRTRPLEAACFAMADCICPHRSVHNFRADWLAAQAAALSSRVMPRKVLPGCRIPVRRLLSRLAVVPRLSTSSRLLLRTLKLTLPLRQLLLRSRRIDRKLSRRTALNCSRSAIIQR